MSESGTSSSVTVESAVRQGMLFLHILMTLKLVK